VVTALKRWRTVPPACGSSADRPSGRAGADRRSHDEAINQVAAAGGEVNLFEGLDRSLLVIDDHIIWHSPAAFLGQPTNAPLLRLRSNWLTTALGHLLLPHPPGARGEVSPWAGMFLECQRCGLPQLARTTRNNEPYFIHPNGHLGIAQWTATASPRGPPVHS
jgi:hypothetical protein